MQSLHRHDVVLVLLVALSLSMHGNAFAETREEFLRKVQVGMTKEQVRDAIGMPLHFATAKDHPLGHTAYWPERTFDMPAGPKDTAACVVVGADGRVAKVFFVPPVSPLTALSAEEATAIGLMHTNDKGAMWLRTIVTLPPEIAKILVESANAGYLAHHLRTQAAYGYFPGNPGRLPDKLREPNERPLVLPAIRTLTPELATQLARYEGPLFLEGLTSLTPELGRILGAHEGIELSLRGLTTLDAATAEGLAKHTPYAPYRSDGSDRDKLYWDGDAMRQKWWARRPYHLDLDGLTTLPDDVAAALASYHGTLDLDGVTSLTPGAARALGRHRGGLRLAALTELPEEVAAGLAQPRAFGIDSHANDGLLDLRGVTSLSAEAARALARHRGNIILGSATGFSPAAAAELAKHEADAAIRYDCTLQFKAKVPLPSLADDVATSLALHGGKLDLSAYSMSHAAWSTLRKAGHNAGTEPIGGPLRPGTWRQAYDESVSRASSGDAVAHVRSQRMLKQLTDRGITLDDLDWGEALLARDTAADSLGPAERDKYRKVLEVLAK